MFNYLCADWYFRFFFTFYLICIHFRAYILDFIIDFVRNCDFAGLANSTEDMYMCVCIEEFEKRCKKSNELENSVKVNSSVK